MSFISNWGPTSLIFIGVIFTAIGGVWSQINQSKHDAEVKQLQKDTIDSIMGGDSYCSVDFSPDMKMFVLTHYGDHPVYNLEIQVVNHQQMAVDKKFPSALLRFEIVNPRTAIPLSIPFTPNSNGHARYNFNMFARNGKSFQGITMRKVNGKWEYDSQLSIGDISDSNPKVIKDRSPGYPKDSVEPQPK